MNVGIYVTLFGMALSLIALGLTYRKPSPAQSPMEPLDDATLIERGLWDECDGEPMNEWAEEYERRHGILQSPQAPKQEGGGE